MLKVRMIDSDDDEDEDDVEDDEDGSVKESGAI